MAPGQGWVLEAKESYRLANLPVWQKKYWPNLYIRLGEIKEIEYPGTDWEKYIFSHARLIGDECVWAEAYRKFGVQAVMWQINEIIRATAWYWEICSNKDDGTLYYEERKEIDRVENLVNGFDKVLEILRPFVKPAK